MSATEKKKQSAGRKDGRNPTVKQRQRGERHYDYGPARAPGAPDLRLPVLRLRLLSLAAWCTPCAWGELPASTVALRAWDCSLSFLFFSRLGGIGGGVVRILGWVSEIWEWGEKSRVMGIARVSERVVVVDGRLKGMCGGDGGGSGAAIENADEAGEEKCDDDVLPEVLCGKGYSKGVEDVAKGVPTICELGEWKCMVVISVFGAGMAMGSVSAGVWSDETSLEEGVETAVSDGSGALAGSLESHRASRNPDKERKLGGWVLRDCTDGW